MLVECQIHLKAGNANGIASVELYMIKTASALAKKNKKWPFCSPVNHVQRKIAWNKNELNHRKRGHRCCLTHGWDPHHSHAAQSTLAFKCFKGVH